MCNFYNASASSASNNCNYASYANSTNYFNGWGTQFMCRDCNGNIYARNVTNCGCSSCCRCNCCHNSCNCCQNGCGSNSGNDAATGNNGNGNFTCVTFCGNTLNGFTQSTTATTTNRGCGCGCGWQRRCGYRSWF